MLEFTGFIMKNILFGGYMKRLFIVFLCFFFFVGNLQAAYLRGVPQKITQPDGTIIECFASGDEFHNWAHDENNFTIIQDHETGWYVYATVVNDKLIPSPYIVGTVDPKQAGLTPGANITAEEWMIKRAEYNNVIENTRSSTPNTGTVNNLVIYIRFNDQEEFTGSYYLATHHYNRVDNYSLFGYFEEVSDGQLHITSHLYPIPPADTLVSYQDSHDRDYFCPYDATTNPIGYENTTQRREREWQLLRDAIVGVSSQISPGIDFDSNNDGILDALVFQIRGDTAGGWNSLLWPHYYWFGDVPPNSYPVVNGLNVVNYCFVMGNSSCATKCHEMFHSIGAPDLYHYAEDSIIDPVERWDIMAYTWNPPAHMLTYMKWKYGQWFSNIPVITSPGTYTLSPVSTSPFSCYKIPSPYSVDEYFMVEYRRDEGFYEQTLNDSGLIVYRIDTTVGDGNAGGPPDEVYVYRPNGTIDTNGEPYNANYSQEEGRTAIHRFTNPTPFLQDGSEGGLVIYDIGVSDDTISFTYAPEMTLYWEGDVSSDWNNGFNWTYYNVPSSHDNVIIPSGTPYSPLISVGDAYCKDLTIQSGATLAQTGTEIFMSYLYVGGNFDSDEGTYSQTGVSYLYLTGDSNTWWDDDNEDDTYSNVFIQKSSASKSVMMWQNMTVDNNFQIREGIFTIIDDWTLTVMSSLAVAFQVEDGSKLSLQAGIIDVPYGDVEFENGSQAFVTGGLIKCGGNFRVYANSAYDIQFTGGTVEMIGSSQQYIQDVDGNTELFDLVINKSGGSCIVQSEDLVVKNDLTISSGILDSNNNYIYLSGDWTNNVGDAGFDESTGIVIFNGAELSEITTDETFYNLLVNNTSIQFNGLQLNSGLTTTILHNLSITDGSFELDSNSTLIVGNDVYIADGSGLNAYGETGLEIFVGGSWTNNNYYWDTALGYSPGTEVITFNGSADQIITTQAPQEDFGNLVIDKSGGEFRPNDNVHVMHDFDIIAGGWHDNTSSLTHYFEGDFYIAAGALGYWNSMTDNTVVFTGLNDQTVFNTAGYHYFCNIIVDKTEWLDRDFTNNEGTEYNLLNHELINPANNVDRNRNMTVTLVSDIDMQMGIGLTIEEGTLDLNGMSLNSMGDVVVYLGGALIIDEGAVLNVSNGNELTVYNGGVLEVLGSPDNLATITHRVTGNYDFNIYPGGTISAEYGLFEYMTANGVYVWDGGIIDQSYSLNYSTFQNGFVGYGTLLYINNADDVTITGANFPDDSSSDYNVTKTYDQGSISMINAIGIFAGYDNELDLYDRIDWDGLPAIDDLTIHYYVVDNTIVLNWTYPFPVDRYKIYRSTDPYEFLGAEVFISYTESYSEAASGTKYFYRVTAENISDNGVVEK